jgi:hypothetical protein
MREEVELSIRNATGTMLSPAGAVVLTIRRPAGTEYLHVGLAEWSLMLGKQATPVAAELMTCRSGR